MRIAEATNSVVAELKMVPNEPLVFHKDGVGRGEDDLIAYTWDMFLKTGDDTWPARCLTCRRSRPPANLSRPPATGTASA